MRVSQSRAVGRYFAAAAFGPTKRAAHDGFSVVNFSPAERVQLSQQFRLAREDEMRSPDARCVRAVRTPGEISRPCNARLARREYHTAVPS